MHGKPRSFFRHPGAGPVKVITDKGILEPDAETGELILTTVYPGVTVDEVKAGVSWPLAVREHLIVAPAPTSREKEALTRVQAE